MSKPVYRANVGHDPDELVYLPIYTSSLGLRCDFCGQPAEAEVLILPEFDARLACVECEWRDNVTFIEEDYDGYCGDAEVREPEP